MAKKPEHPNMDHCEPWGDDPEDHEPTPKSDIIAKVAAERGWPVVELPLVDLDCDRPWSGLPTIRKESD